MGASHFLRSLLFGVHAWDPVTLSGVCVMLGVVSFAAVFLPARRAASVDPAEAQRNAIYAFVLGQAGWLIAIGLAVGLQGLADGVLVREVFLGQRDIDDGNAWPGRVIRLGEESSADQCGADGGKVSGTDMAFVDFILSGQFGLPHDLDRVGAAIALNGKKAGESHSLDARQQAHALRDFLVELAGTMRCGNGNMHGGKMGRVEAQRYVQQAVQAPGE